MIQKLSASVFIEQGPWLTTSSLIGGPLQVSTAVGAADCSHPTK
jgi:hypothetical protein